MVAYIKNHKLSLLLVGIAMLTILRMAIPFSSGYFGRFYDIFLLCTEAIRYICIVSCAVVVIISKLDRKSRVLASMTGVFLIAVGLVPTSHFMTLGAWLSIQNANPAQIRDDARLLMDKYQPQTLFSNNRNQRYPFNHPIPKSELPLSLQNENLNDVLVLDHYVFLEKFGVTALFRGFIVFREGSDIWENEKSITLIDGCNYCWKIRIIDGLYWYHDVPREEEIATFVLPLK